jgi:hypothetical protein
VLFFGYAVPRCLPTTLAALARAVKSLGGRRPRQVVFVTVDPTATPPSFLRATSAFDPSFVACAAMRTPPPYGEGVQILYQKQPGKTVRAIRSITRRDLVFDPRAAFTALCRQRQGPGLRPRHPRAARAG